MSFSVLNDHRYSLLFGRAPFQSNEVKNIYKNIKENAYNFPPTAGVSEAAKSLITLILTPDPGNFF